MDLAYAYLKNNGMTGHLKELNPPHNTTVLSFAKEGEYPQYKTVNTDKLDEILQHWEITGKLVIEEYNALRRQMDRTETEPDFVMVLRPETSYFRRDYPA